MKREHVPPVIALVVTALSVAAVFRWVDLSPRVEADFFFSRDDPQLAATVAVAEQFPSPELVIVRVAGGDPTDQAYRDYVRRLSTAFRAVAGVTGVNSIASEDLRSPLWGPILVNRDATSTNLVVQVESADPARLLPALESVLAETADPAYDVQMSGVPVVVELIRRNLLRDLTVFSTTALVLFGTLIGLVYRRTWIVVGMLSGCLLAIATTLMLAKAFSIGIGLLTANIAVIVFVLTLSHMVFLTANWQTAAGSPVERVRVAVRETRVASFWCMLTTLLGFLSLLVATAKPLRELGVAGAVGTVAALLVAYLTFPSFLSAATEVDPKDAMHDGGGGGGGFLAPRWTLAVVASVIVVMAFGVTRLSTDPPLLSYFEQDGELRQGLELIDRDGGSSPLSVVVRDPQRRTVAHDAVLENMWQLQERFEADASVGVIVSPVLLIAEARRSPLTAFLPTSMLLDIVQGPLLRGVGLSYISPERDEGRFFLRMREAGRSESRDVVIARIRDHVATAGLEVAQIGGQYDMMNQLGKLIGSSLKIGLGGLLLLFVGIAIIVSRHLPTTGVLVACLLGILAVVLGTMGYAGMPVDIIASPAANVALAMGVDAMIHTVMRARRLGAMSGRPVVAWSGAVRELWRPVVSAAFIISVGFGIFGLSTFPPTQRFGLAVIVGTLTAAFMALVVLPRAAVMTWSPRR